MPLSHREYAVQHSQDGRAELDAQRVCTASLEVIGEAAAAVSADPVRSMAISSQGEAFMPIDASGRILAHAMVSSDTRAASVAQQWTTSFGAARLYQITGHTAHPMFTLFKLLWTRGHRPDAWRQASRFLCFEDLLHTRLGLEPHIGWPLAGRTMLFDVRAHAWSPEILAAIDLEPSRLATPLASGSHVGVIARRVASRLGLKGDVFVVAGGHDQMCAALGSGIVSPGSAMYATGTVECIAAIFPAPGVQRRIDGEQSVHLRRGNNRHVRHGGLLFDRRKHPAVVSRSIRRGRTRGSRATTGENIYDLLLQQVPVEPSTLLVLPYFTPSGTPYFDLRTPGVVFGLRLSTSRGELLRALLEGVALEMRVNTEILGRAGIPIREFRASGGGARNARWNQLKADILEIPIATVSTTETGCCGAAMLAASAHLGVPVASLAETWIHTLGVFEPDRQRSAFYREQFERYRQLYQAVRGLHSHPPPHIKQP